VCLYVFSCVCYIGQLGIGSTVDISETETPGNSKTVDLGANAVVTAVASGYFSVCAIVDDTVKCWGLGSDGQLGQGNTDSLGNMTATVPAKFPPIK
jgi:alpha-tubulin suppressor-like RCC1 family protein